MHTGSGKKRRAQSGRAETSTKGVGAKSRFCASSRASRMSGVSCVISQAISPREAQISRVFPSSASPSARRPSGKSSSKPPPHGTRWALTPPGAERHPRSAPCPFSYGEQGWFPDSPPRTHEVSVAFLSQIIRQCSSPLPVRGS